MKIKLFIANPAGNTTIFVLSPTQREDYQRIANKLLEMDFGAYCDWGDSVYGEQVSFILPELSEEGYPAMEMCGLEFCGNASRAFAYFQSACCGADSDVTVSVSGCDYPLKAKVNVEGHEALIQMPVPTHLIRFTAAELGLEEEYPQMPDGILVNMDGISHLVLKDVEAGPERFDMLKECIYSKVSDDLPAFGVMFIDSAEDRMTPVVYVKDVNTTYFEGSCASGTTAASFALALGDTDGEHDYTFVQPKGTLFTHVRKNAGEILSIDLSGHMELSDIIIVEM